MLLLESWDKMEIYLELSRWAACYANARLGNLVIREFFGSDHRSLGFA